MNAVAENILRLRERVAAAAERSGRSGSEITLVAVTKHQPVSAVVQALAAGVTDIGENYVQEASVKRAEGGDGRWHLLGHLQTNKARQAIQLFDLIQSVDSVKLAKALAGHAQTLGERQAILLQVHLGDEGTKTGLPPMQVQEVWTEIAACPGLELRGLMGIAPNGVDARPYFRSLRRLYDALPGNQHFILSMGMTGDFETAIEEGATMIRVGTAIFGPRR